VVSHHVHYEKITQILGKHLYKSMSNDFLPVNIISDITQLEVINRNEASYNDENCKDISHCRRIQHSRSKPKFPDWLRGELRQYNAALRH
jgi:hypothetical protein